MLEREEDSIKANQEVSLLQYPTMPAGGIYLSPFKEGNKRTLSEKVVFLLYGIDWIYYYVSLAYVN